MPLRSLVLGLLLGCCYMHQSLAAERLTLISQSTAQHRELKLSEADWRWLRNKRGLLLGTASPNALPMEISSAHHEFQGLTADYLKLMASSLGLRVQVRRYPSRQAALKALVAGDIDLLGNATPFEAQAHGLLLSKAYVSDTPTLVARVGQAPPLKGSRLALAPDYLPLEKVRELYPRAILMPYASAQAALRAVVFGQADLLLSNSLSAQFLLNLSYSEQVHVLRSEAPVLPGFSFAVARRNPQLRRMLNQALAQIPHEQQIGIHRRWGDKRMLSLTPLELSIEQRRWIHEHPRVQVGVSRGLAPLSYFGPDNRYQGLTADLLQLISAQTGLRFEIQAFDDVEQMYSAVQQHKVQVLTPLARSPERETLLHFTRPLLYAPYVLVTRNQAQAPQSLEQMHGKTLVLPIGHSLLPTLRKHYPGIRLQTADSRPQALDMLADHRADATLINELSASHALPQIHSNHLKLSAALDRPQSVMSLAVRRDQLELFAILEQALADIPADVLMELSHHWRRQVPLASPSWRDYQPTLYRLAAGAGLLLLMALGWGWGMRRQVLQRQQLLEQLRQAKARADSANQAKSDFLASMSHEIRTPMHAVLGLLELALKRADLGQADRPSLALAHDSTQGLLALLGDSLDISRIESGRLQLNPQRTDLRTLLETLVRVFEPTARGKGLQLQLEIQHSAPGDVLVDPLRLKQILSNLTSNALKFTERGQVRICAQLLPAGSDQVQLQLCVQDSGPGISDADQQRLFQPFSQIHGAHQAGHGGSGLGLLISRSLCEMMGGRLQLQSTPGVGTRVWLHLPLTSLPAATQEPPAAPLARPLDTHRVLRVLVVDDNSANRRLLCKQLQFLGHQPRPAQWGAAALELWQAETFDLLITDCNMPQMNGYQLARQIRQLERQQQRRALPIWGYTAQVQAEERQRCLAAGMDACLFKPMALDELQQALEELARSAPLPPELPRMPHLNLDALRQFAGDNPEVLRQVLLDILDSHRQDLQKVGRLLLADHDAGIAELAHSIKGAARIINAQRLIASCQQLEQAWRQSAPLAQLKQHLTGLQQLMLEFDDDLQQLLEQA
ncbi:transporter substrate-binding domain-containing protein [Pseudomonas sp. NFXW11]|uniref:transporter substrate-binding domain-containing protein n=1 Tax=Pseudomonas sp. NFXW11 TaxID=2819531 RepID=UPI003CF89FC2